MPYKKMTTPIKNIAIIMAMETEAAPIIHNLQMQPIYPKFNPLLGLMAYQSHKYQNHPVSLIINGKRPNGEDGIGVVSATLTAYETVRVLQPDVIISAGTAGGIYKRQANLGDVYVSKGGSAWHDHRIPAAAMPLFKDYTTPTTGLEIDVATKSLQLKTGRISTGSSFHVIPEDERQVDNNDAIAMDMEAAAIAEVAKTLKVPFFAVKAISNMVSSSCDMGQAMTSGFPLAVSNLGFELERVISFMLGKTPLELRFNLSSLSPGVILDATKTVLNEYSRPSSTTLFNHSNPKEKILCELCQSKRSETMLQILYDHCHSELEDAICDILSRIAQLSLSPSETMDLGKENQYHC